MLPQGGSGVDASMGKDGCGVGDVELVVVRVFSKDAKGTVFGMVVRGEEDNGVWVGVGSRLGGSLERG